MIQKTWKMRWTLNLDYQNLTDKVLMTKKKKSHGCLKRNSRNKKIRRLRASSVSGGAHVDEVTKDVIVCFVYH